MAYRPLFLFPALAIAVVIAIAFFKIYGRATRPPAPVPVSATVDHFAPGVAIGSTVKASSAQLRGVSWVPKVGFVGTLPPNLQFAQVRLYVSPEERAKAVGTEDAEVESVELVSAKSEEMSRVMSDLTIVFRTAPKDGCITPVYEDAPVR